jgi:hypothetical protein
MKASQLTRRILVITLFLLSLAPAIAGADEMAYRIVGYLTKYDLKPVGDVEGHVTGEFVRRGLAFFTSGPAKGEVGVYVNVGTIDTTSTKTTARGESTITLEDGSSFTVKNLTESEPGHRGVNTVKAEIAKGTGRFEGITGKGTGTGRVVTPFHGETKSDAYYDMVVSYMLPKPRT